MKKMLLFAALAVVLVASAAAQDVYQLNYYSNSRNTAGADQVTRIVNPGTVGTPIGPTEGTLCANVYVFDNTQEMLECCSCPITANGILQLSLLENLLQNPLTGLPIPTSGVIKIVSSTAAGRSCPAGTETAPAPVPGLLAWQTHIQAPTAGTFVTTEDGFKASILTQGGNSQQTELEFLGQACSFVQYLGSGKGKCTCGGIS